MAARFRVGSSTLWSDTAGWSTTSGGAGGSAVPAAVDDVTFDSNSTVSVTLDTPTAKLAKTLTCTGYTQTLTFNTTLTVAGNVTLGAGMTLAGSSALIVSTTATITTAGVTVAVPLTLNGASITYTLGDNLAISALLTLGPAGGSSNTINANAITASGGLTIGPSSGTVSGTTTITLTGGTLTAANSSQGGLRNNLTFNGNVTISGTFGFGGTMTYTSGTITTTGTMLIVTVASTLNVAAITWHDVAHQQSVAVTLAADWNIDGTLTLGAGNNTTTTNGAFNVNARSVTIAATTGQITGTSTLVLASTGTLQDSGSGTGGLRMNTTINSGGTVTISGTVRYGTGTFTYTAGTVVSGTLSINLSASLDLNGLTLTSLQTTTAGVAVTLKSGLSLSGSFTSTGTAAAPVTYGSNVGGTRRALTILGSATEDVGYTSPTDIDSSAGLAVGHYKGTVTNTLHWVDFTPTVPGSAAYAAPFFGG
jgi:hypothetical protein